MDFSFLSAYLNPLDIAAAAVILALMILAGRRGLIKSVYNLVSFFVSIFLANMLYPYIGRFLRETDGINEWFRSTLTKVPGIPDAADFTTKSAQNLFIVGLDLPDFMKFSLMENNNPEAYGILNAAGLSDYIGGFIANLMMNIVSILLAFLVIYIAMKLLGRLLNAIAELPVINVLNRFGGLVIGFLQGVIAIWLLFAGFTLFLSRPSFVEFQALLDRSSLAAVLYDNNFILHMVARVVP